MSVAQQKLYLFLTDSSGDVRGPKEDFFLFDGLAQGCPWLKARSADLGWTRSEMSVAQPRICAFLMDSCRNVRGSTKDLLFV